MKTEAPADAIPFCVLPPRIPPAQATVAAARYRLAADDGAPPASGMAWLLPHGGGRDGIAAALAGSAFYVVELDGGGGADGDWMAVPPVEHGFLLSLTTATAFESQIAGLVCDALVARHVLGDQRRAPVELCLHEAVANAVVHGNLGLASTAREHAEGYRRFSTEMKERLRDPDLGRRRTDVLARWTPAGLAVAVADQGAGFDAARLPARPDADAACGRGFVFMRSLADRVEIGNGGRCTVLHFAV